MTHLAQSDSLVIFTVLPSCQHISECFFSVFDAFTVNPEDSSSAGDALDDDETPLRLTASQTATTRVMVSGIMGALALRAAWPENQR